MAHEDTRSLMLEPGLCSGGNAVALLEDGREAYPAMLEAIASARHSVLLEMYTFASDATGRRFAAALAAKAKEGVTVRVMYDAAGSRDSATSIFQDLRAAGAFVTPFRPLGWYTWRKRDHRKLLVVDGRVGILGGLNLSDEYSPEGGNWRDAALRIEGPEVTDLVSIYAAVWREEEDDALFPKGPPPRAAAVAGGVDVAVMGSGRAVERRLIARHMLHAIRNARKRVWIANAYFVPSLPLLLALKRAARRKVDVRIVLSVKTDAAPVYHASRSTFDGLLKAGVRIYEYPARVLHSKTMLVDEGWSMVGSANLDHLSLFHNYELSAVVLDAGIGARLARMYEDDFAASVEVKRPEWRRRPWPRKVAEEFCWLLKSLI